MSASRGVPPPAWTAADLQKTAPREPEATRHCPLRFRVIASRPRVAAGSGVPQLIPPANESAEVAEEGDPHGAIALNGAPCADDVVGRRGQAPPSRKLACGGWHEAAENVLVALGCGRTMFLACFELLEKKWSPWSCFGCGVVASIARHLAVEANRVFFLCVFFCAFLEPTATDDDGCRFGFGWVVRREVRFRAGSCESG